MRRIAAGLIFATALLGSSASNSTGSFPGSNVTPSIDGRSHVLKLNSLVIPASPATGLFLKARIDGGPTLRLLLDSGAQNIVLSKRAAAKSGYSGGAELDLVGAGESTSVARMATAGSVAIGDLEFHDCALIIVDHKLLDGIDGVIPLSLFSNFLVRLDIPGKSLQLQPFPADSRIEAGDAHQARSSNDLLFIKGVLNDSSEGYVLLDTGALYNAISERTARALRLPRLFSSPLPVQGGTGTLDARMYSAEVRFRFGSQVLQASEVLVLPLDQMERYHRLEVAGVLGFPALRDSVLCIDYRTGLVSIAEK